MPVWCALVLLGSIPRDVRDVRVEALEVRTTRGDMWSPDRTEVIAWRKVRGQWVVRDWMQVRDWPSSREREGRFESAVGPPLVVNGRCGMWRIWYPPGLAIRSYSGDGRTIEKDAFRWQKQLFHGEW